MANIQFFHPADNVGPNATVSTSGTADADYPLTYAVDLSYAKLAAPAKLTAVTGDMILDFGAAQRVDAVLVWHNLDEDVAYAVQMHASNSWGTPTVNVTGAAPAKRADGYTVKLFHDLTGVAGYSSGGFRYLRVHVSGANSVPVGLKILAFSRIRTLARNISWGVELAEHQTGIDMTTDALHPWAYDLAAPPRLLVADLLSTDADALAVKEWFRACGGRAKVTCVVPDPDNPDAILGRWSEGSVGVVSPALKVQRLGDRHDFLDQHTMRIAIEEITPGDPEWV